MLFGTMFVCTVRTNTRLSAFLPHMAHSKPISSLTVRPRTPHKAGAQKQFFRVIGQKELVENPITLTE